MYFYLKSSFNLFSFYCIKISIQNFEKLCMYVFCYSLMYVELPWDQPSIQCQEFINWKDNDRWSTQTPWSKLDTLAISLLRKALATNPTYRLTLDKIFDHKWCNMQFMDSGEFFLHIFYFK